MQGISECISRRERSCVLNSTKSPVADLLLLRAPAAMVKSMGISTDRAWTPCLLYTSYLFLILEITVSPPTVLLDFTSSKEFKIVFASYIFLIVFSSDGISEYKPKQQHIADRPGGD